MTIVLHKLTIKLSERDYLDFLFESNEHGLTAEEQIHQIINYYILVRRRRLKVKFSKNNSLKFKTY